MKKTFLISLIFIGCFNAFSQDCQIKDSLTYQDSLYTFLNFTFHLYSNKKIEFQAKFTSTFKHEESDSIDSVFYYLIPDSEQESLGDGEFISMLLHRSTILKQTNPKWFEITELKKEKDHYNLTLTLNQFIHNETFPIYILKYQVFCKDPKRALIFKKEKIKKTKPKS